jgi:hypothetical protein
MINQTLQSLLRESKNRPAGQAAFAQAVNRLFTVRSQKDDQKKTAPDQEKAA